MTIPNVQVSSHRDESAWALLGLTRFMLATIVVTGHLSILSHVYKLRDGWIFVGLWFNQGSAVFAFLLISGYSIAASLERSSEGFYRRRFIRIYPMYLLALALASMAGFLLSPSLTLGDGTIIIPPPPVPR